MKTIRVKESGIKKEMTYIEALQRKIVTLALNGSVPAMRLLQESLEKIDNVRHAEENNQRSNCIRVKFVKPKEYRED